MTPPPAIVVLCELTNQPICAEASPHIFSRSLSEAKNHTGTQKANGVIME